MHFASLLCQSNTHQSNQRTPLFKQNNNQLLQHDYLFKDGEQSKLTHVLQHPVKQKKLSLKMFNPLKFDNKSNIKKDITLNDRITNFEKQHQNRRIQLVQNKKEGSYNLIQFKNLNKKSLNNLKSQKLIIYQKGPAFLNQNKNPIMRSQNKINFFRGIEIDKSKKNQQMKKLPVKINFIDSNQLQRYQIIKSYQTNKKYVQLQNSHQIKELSGQLNQLNIRNQQKEKYNFNYLKLKQQLKNSTDLQKVKQDNKLYNSKSKESFTTLANSYLNNKNNLNQQKKFSDDKHSALAKSVDIQHKINNLNLIKNQNDALKNNKHENKIKKLQRNYSFFKGIDNLVQNKFNQIQQNKQLPLTDKKLSSLKIKPAQSFVESEKSSSEYSEVQYILSARMQI